MLKEFPPTQSTSELVFVMEFTSRNPTQEIVSIHALQFPSNIMEIQRLDFVRLPVQLVTSLLMITTDANSTAR